MMSLDRVIAAPFQQAGTRSLTEQEFVVHLSLQRDWFSPDQAKRVVDLGVGDGLIERTDDGLVARIDPTAVTVPSGFVPAEDVLTRRSTFERMLDRFEAAGRERRRAVADINRCQNELGISIEAAAALHAAREGVDLGETVPEARDECLAPAEDS